MSRTNLAHSSDSKAFDDLLGQLVDELAMSPASPQADPAPQVRPAPHPDDARYAGEPGATPYVVPPTAPPRSNRTPIAVAGIIGGSIVALGVAAMLILPGGSSSDTPTPAAQPAPTVVEAAPVAAPTPPPPMPVPVVVPTPVPAEEPTDAAADEDAAKASATPTPVKKPKKKPKKKPPTKKPKPSGDSFDDM